MTDGEALRDRIFALMTEAGGRALMCLSGMAGTGGCRGEGTGQHLGTRPGPPSKGCRRRRASSSPS